MENNLDISFFEKLEIIELDKIVERGDFCYREPDLELIRRIIASFELGWHSPVTRARDWFQWTVVLDGSTSPTKLSSEDFDVPSCGDVLTVINCASRLAKMRIQHARTKNSQPRYLAHHG